MVIFTSVAVRSRSERSPTFYDVGGLLTEMGAKILVAVTTTQSPVLERVEAEEVLIGDLRILETLSKAKGCDLLVTHSHGRQAAERLKIPFYRIGIPMFDRLGAGHQLRSVIVAEGI